MIYDVPRWYALYTKSNYEKIVHDFLGKKSINSFLPTHKVPSRRKDRKLIIDAPLFKGYVFVKTDFNPDEHLAIIKTVGAVKFIGYKEGPVPIEDETIEAIRIMLSGGGKITTGDKLQRGEKVMVMEGPFSGLIGTFVQYMGARRIIVNIDALGQFASVEINDDIIERMPQHLA